MENKIIHLVGNAHLDPVWLWRWQQGFAEIKATFQSALDRMNEFPEFIFTSACAAYYQWIEENCPEMFEEIKQRVKEGRWIIVGGWWIQSDCNIPSGESFVRHGLYSQGYFKEKFGVIAKVGYNVDSFGHNGMLPQILKKSGMDYYVFQRPSDHEKDLPSNLFWWESMDGSRVMTFKIPFGYGTSWSRKEDITDKRLKTLALAEEQGTDFMLFYGVGNHGGGPTISNLKNIRALQEQYGKETIIHSSPDQYFKAMLEKNPDLPVIQDDLQHHASGCYSTHSETKKSNRRAEHRLLMAETFACVAHGLLKYPYKGEKIKQAWKNVLFNQFHDIIAGCSIKEAYDDAREFYGESLKIGGDILNGALQRISWAIDTSKDMGQVSLTKESDGALWEQDNKGVPIVVFNPLPWTVERPVQVYSNAKSVEDSQGRSLERQTVRASRTNGRTDKWDTLFMAKVPGFGYRVYWIYKNKEQLPEVVGEDSLLVDSYTMENKWLKIEIQPHTGFISKLYDKDNDVDILKGKGAVPIVIDEYDSDTWAHNIFVFRDEVGKFGDAEVRVIEEGPLRGVIRVTSRYNQSTLRQDYILHKDSKEIQVRAKLDWREKHKMLKLSFPVNVDNPKATYEIPYGYIERPVNGEEEPGQKWVDVSGQPSSGIGDTYGLSLLNDCKYSFDVLDNDMRMTVVRGSIFADHYGVRDDLCEFMDQGEQEFVYTLVPHKGDWKDTGIVQKAYELNAPYQVIAETYHKGVLPLEFEGISLSQDNVIASVFKRAEDESGYVLRCYETAKKETQVNIDIPMIGRQWTAHIDPCEIKTFIIPDDPSKSIYETDFLE